MQLHQEVLKELRAKGATDDEIAKAILKLAQNEGYHNKES